MGSFMPEILTLKLPEKLRFELDEVARDEGKPANEIINKAVQDYLFFQRFRLLREKFVAKAQSQGIFTDQDLFERVS